MRHGFDVDFPSLKGRVSEAEWLARIDLAACYRLVDRYGMTDLIYNHITSSIPDGPGRLLINLYGLLVQRRSRPRAWSRSTSTVMCIRKPDTAYGINQSGYVIHGCIHRARSDVHCVIHTHTRAGMAVSAMRCGLLPITQTAGRFHGHIAQHDFEGPAVDLAEQERLVRDLGRHDAMILRNHGLLVCGPSVPQAFNLMYQLEMACRAQVDAMAAGIDQIALPDEATLQRSAHLYRPGTRRPFGELSGPRCCGSSRPSPEATRGMTTRGRRSGRMPRTLRSPIRRTRPARVAPPRHHLRNRRRHAPDRRTVPCTDRRRARNPAARRSLDPGYRRRTRDPGTPLSSNIATATGAAPSVKTETGTTDRTPSGSDRQRAG